MTYSEEDEREAHIENMKADTEYKRMLADWEPWKAMAVAAGGGATLMLALVALFTFVLAHFFH